MGDKDNGPAGPRCIALVGPFQSGKTTLLEAILSRTGAIARQGTVEAGTTVGDASKEARHHKMSVEVDGRHHDLHGRQLHLHRLPRFGGIRPRHARRAAGGRCRRGGMRGGRPQGRAAAADFARTRRSENPALSVPQQDRQDRQAGPRKPAAYCSRRRGCRCCCGKFRSGRTTSSTGSSTSRWNAPSSTANTRPPR